MENTKRLYASLNEDQLVQLASEIGKLLPASFVIYLNGTLGAGKTAFCRGLIRSLGHTGAVKSPTYTLLEPYQNLKPVILHFDLYRLANPEELEYIGIRDYADEQAVFLIEWPECGKGFLPAADLILDLAVNQDGSRSLLLQGKSIKSAQLIGALT